MCFVVGVWGVFGCGLVGAWCWWVGVGAFWCWVVSVWCVWCVRGCGLVGVGWRVLVGVRVVVVSDAHVSGLFLFLGFVFCFVLLFG